MEEDKVKACPLERTMPSDPNMAQQSSFGSFARSVMRRLGPLGLFPTSLRYGHRALTDQRHKKNYAFLDIHWITASLYCYTLLGTTGTPGTLSINII